MEQIIYIIDNIFEGPLDLLLFLIKEHKVQIADITLTDIIEQFFDKFRKTENFPIENTGNFISITSELINIKSRNLLNQNDEAVDFSDEELFNHQEFFIEKLIEYKSLKDAFDKIVEEERNVIPIFSKNQPEIILEDKNDENWQSISIVDLFNHFESIISKLPKQKDFIISRSTVTVDEMIKNIKELLNENEFLLFSSIISQYNSRIEFICLFLAILELVKSKFAKISQIDHFLDIKISKIK